MKKPKRNLGKVVWWNGKFILPSQAKTSIFTHSLHYGVGVFEGIRCYKTHGGKLAVFRLKEHIDRLFDSCKIVEIKIPYSKNTIYKAIVETIQKSGLKDGCYVRPIVFIGEVPLAVYPGENPPIETVITTWYWGAYLGDAREKGARIKVSSFSRGWVNNIMSKGKITGQYISSVLAKSEARRCGYDEGLLLDTEGYIAEGSGENIFIYKDGVLKTTPLTSILPGITRSTIITLAQEEGIPVVEQRFTRDEVYCAEEAFFTGTAAEITPIRELDSRSIGIGKPGPITKKLSKRYFDVVLGKEARYQNWLTYL